MYLYWNKVRLNYPNTLRRSEDAWIRSAYRHGGAVSRLQPGTASRPSPGGVVQPLHLRRKQVPPVCLGVGTRRQPYHQASQVISVSQACQARKIFNILNSAPLDFLFFVKHMKYSVNHGIYANARFATIPGPEIRAGQQTSASGDAGFGHPISLAWWPEPRPHL